MSAPVDAARMMARALALAARGRGRTSPNPMVGAVVVRAGEIVGEGFHPQAGEPHAEVFALAEAGERARGADLYVTLEPCNHHGRTPPCTEAILRAGVRRVFVGAVDPNPLVAGAGVQRLRAAGIEVVTGVGGEAATRLNEAFNHWIVHRTPFVCLKLATSLDGRIATAAGKSKWITGPAARSRVHRLRADVDAVMVGRGTAVADDPRLTARGVEGDYTPAARVVVDSQLALPPSAALLDPALPGQPIVATAADADAPSALALRARGALLWSLPGGEGRVDLPALMERLGTWTGGPVTSLLVEGGGVLAASLLTEGLVHKVIWHQAPTLLGGDGRPGVGDLHLDAPADGPRLDIASMTRVGDDLELIAYPQKPSSA